MAAEQSVGPHAESGTEVGEQGMNVGELAVANPGAWSEASSVEAEPGVVQAGAAPDGDGPASDSDLSEPADALDNAPPASEGAGSETPQGPAFFDENGELMRDPRIPELNLTEAQDEALGQALQDYLQSTDSATGLIDPWVEALQGDADSPSIGFNPQDWGAFDDAANSVLQPFDDSLPALEQGADLPPSPPDSEPALPGVGPDFDTPPPFSTPLPFLPSEPPEAPADAFTDPTLSEPFETLAGLPGADSPDSQDPFAGPDIGGPSDLLTGMGLDPLPGDAGGPTPFMDGSPIDFGGGGDLGGGPPMDGGGPG